MEVDHRALEQESINDQLRLDIEDLRGQLHQARAQAAATTAAAALARSALATAMQHETAIEAERTCSRCGDGSQWGEGPESVDGEVTPTLVCRATG
jgi:hypothetical protein